MTRLRFLFGLALGLGCILSACSDGSGPSDRTVHYQQVATGYHLTCGLTDHQDTFCWGNAGFANDSVPTPVETPEPLVRLAIGSGAFNQSMCGLSATGKVYCWGSFLGGLDVLDNYGDGLSPVTMADSLQFTELAAGVGHVCGITTGQSTVCWGSWLFGKRGLDGAFPVDCGGGGSCFADLNANQVDNAPVFTRLAAGRQQSCGVTAAGNLYCWGDSLSAGTPQAVFAHGDSVCFPSTACVLTPAPLTGLAGIGSVAAGGAQTCALTTTGVLSCWGINAYGEVGNGSTSDVPSPVVIAVGEPVSQVTAGALHTCALGVSGSAYCWGMNQQGQTGAPAGGNVPQPGKVSFNQSFISLSAGASHTCGITQGHDLYCWGDNTGGELGDGSHQSSSVPVRVKAPR